MNEGKLIDLWSNSVKELGRVMKVEEEKIKKDCW